MRILKLLFQQQDFPLPPENHPGRYAKEFYDGEKCFAKDPAYFQSRFVPEVPTAAEAEFQAWVKRTAEAVEAVRVLDEKAASFVPQAALLYLPLAALVPNRIEESSSLEALGLPFPGEGLFAYIDRLAGNHDGRMEYGEMRRALSYRFAAEILRRLLGPLETEEDYLWAVEAFALPHDFAAMEKDIPTGVVAVEKGDRERVLALFHWLTDLKNTGRCRIHLTRACELVYLRLLALDMAGPPEVLPAEVLGDAPADMLPEHEAWAALARVYLALENVRSAPAEETLARGRETLRQAFTRFCQNEFLEGVGEAVGKRQVPDLRDFPSEKEIALRYGKFLAEEWQPAASSPLWEVFLLMRNFLAAAGKSPTVSDPGAPLRVLEIRGRLAELFLRRWNAPAAEEVRPLAPFTYDARTQRRGWQLLLEAWRRGPAAEPFREAGAPLSEMLSDLLQERTSVEMKLLPQGSIDAELLTEPELSEDDFPPDLTPEKEAEIYDRYFANHDRWKALQGNPRMEGVLFYQKDGVTLSFGAPEVLEKGEVQFQRVEFHDAKREVHVVVKVAKKDP